MDQFEEDFSSQSNTSFAEIILYSLPEYQDSFRGSHSGF